MFLDFMYILFVIAALFAGLLFIVIWHIVARQSVRLSFISLSIASIYLIVSLFQVIVKVEEEYLPDLAISFFAVVTFTRAYFFAKKNKKKPAREFGQFIDL
tara:strand:- start:34 stop:336 length:303 start_codon:yes stop_codon:yes gene_type:complete